MADKKISQLSAASVPLAGTEVLPIVQSGATVKVSVDNLTAGKSVSAKLLTAATDGTNTNAFVAYSPSTTNGAKVLLADNIGNYTIKTVPSATTELSVTYANDSSEFLRLDATGNLKVNSGNLVIGTSGKGIDFSANTGAAGMTSQLLDDYEEGTWTPVLAPSTGSFAAISYGSTAGKYTKIGNVVYFSLFFETDNLDVTGASGAIKITGLPFATSGTGPSNSSRVGFARRWAGEDPVAWQINASASEILLWYWTALNSDPNLVDVSDLTTGATTDRNQMTITGFYFV